MPLYNSSSGGGVVAGTDSFTVFNTTSQPVLSSGWGNVSFDTTSYDHTNGSLASGVFTCQDAGVYFFQFYLSFTAVTTNPLQVGLSVNGANSGSNFKLGNPVAPSDVTSDVVPAIQGTAIFVLAVNDTVTVRGYGTGGNTLQGNCHNNYFQGHRLS